MEVIVTEDEVTISRWTHTDPLSGFQLHMLCDASLESYSCATYKATGESSGLLLAKDRVELLAKDRVVPLNPSPIVPTISRVELLSCLIGAKLLANVLKLPLPKYCTAHYCRTDSQIALVDQGRKAYEPQQTGVREQPSRENQTTPSKRTTELHTY